MQWFLQDISIGNNLKTLRKKFGYSQSDTRKEECYAIFFTRHQHRQ